MKKTLLILSTLLLLLTGCNPQEDKITDSPKESVELSASNFSTYVAINTTSVFNPDYNDMCFYSYFIGADYCKFVDCKVTYKYVGANTSSEYTVPLTLSGDGQALAYIARNIGRGQTYTLTVTSAKGTVHIYR